MARRGLSERCLSRVHGVVLGRCGRGARHLGSCRRCRLSPSPPLTPAPLLPFLRLAPLPCSPWPAEPPLCSSSHGAPPCVRCCWATPCPPQPFPCLDPRPCLSFCVGLPEQFSVFPWSHKRIAPWPTSRNRRLSTGSTAEHQEGRAAQQNTRQARTNILHGKACQSNMIAQSRPSRTCPR